MSTMLATKRDLLPVATRRDMELLRQEIALLRREVAGMRAQIGWVTERSVGSPLRSYDKFNGDFSRTLASVNRVVTIHVGLIFFTGCALTVAAWRLWS